MEKTEGLPDGIHQESDVRYEKEIADTEIYTESTGDYVLPDYQPEIRKILSLSSELHPSEQYENGGHVEFGGSVKHTIVYSDGEGKMQSETLESDYDYVAELGSEGEGASVKVTESIVGTVCRLSGPRKLSVKTKIKSYLSAFAKEQAESRISCSCPEILRKCDKSIFLLYGNGSFSSSSELEIKNANPETFRILSVTGRVAVKDVKTEKNTAVVRGDVYLTALCDDGSLPFCAENKTPFEEHIYVEGLTQEFDAVAVGFMESTDSEIAENGEDGVTVSLDTTVILNITAGRNRMIYPVIDAYSKTATLQNTEKELPLIKLCHMASGHFPTSGSIGKKESDTIDATAIIATAAETVNADIRAEDGKTVIGGECKIHLLLSYGGDGGLLFGNTEFMLPFRGECVIPQMPALSPRISYRLHTEVFSPKVQMDGDSLVFEGEIGYALTVAERVTENYLSEIGEETPLPKENEASITVIYPETGDTLWEVCKRCHASLSEVAEENRLPQAVLENPDNQASLDGVEKLLILS